MHHCHKRLALRKAKVTSICCISYLDLLLLSSLFHQKRYTPFDIKSSVFLLPKCYETGFVLSQYVSLRKVKMEIIPNQITYVLLI